VTLHKLGRVLCFGLFIIFLYYRESFDSVTKVHSFNAYSKVMFMDEMSLFLPPPLIFRIASIFVWVSIQGIRGFGREKKERERERVASFLEGCINNFRESLWKIHRFLSILPQTQNAIDRHDTTNGFPFGKSIACLS